MTWTPLAPLPPDDPRHGTSGGYSNHLCRCRPCTDAATAAGNEWKWRTGRRRTRAEYLAERAANRTHGTNGGYTCHQKRGETPCAACREAKRIWQKAHRAELRAAKAVA